MGPKPTPSKQGNTLFSYFSKSPCPPAKEKIENTANDVLSPKKSPNRPAKKKPDIEGYTPVLLSVTWKA
ncbi:hypothetical protein DPMN_073272 [Dreissena polymorpha]|uniref:Uncharacterized protein n=1 Tax=Dreissena polymorpha TaxID=45954 RepID=A0A9D4BYW1_DREPO|nr:hypothetical protein DPMN_073272 [Dreissena polymorpha]